MRERSVRTPHRTERRRGSRHETATNRGVVRTYDPNLSGHLPEEIVPARSPSRPTALPRSRVWHRVSYELTSHAILVVVVRRYLRFVTGLENIPDSGPFILTPNHTSRFDHFLLASLIRLVTGKKLFFVARSEFFDRPVSRFWHMSMGSIPLRQDMPDTRAFRAVQELLERGCAVCFYPEGDIGPEGSLMRFHDGAFRVALRGNAPVVPVAIRGAAQILPRGALFPRPLRADVSFGSARHADLIGRSRKDSARALSDAVQLEILSLLKGTTDGSARQRSAEFCRFLLRSLRYRPGFGSQSLWATQRLRGRVAALQKLAERNLAAPA